MRHVGDDVATLGGECFYCGSLLKAAARSLLHCALRFGTLTPGSFPISSRRTMISRRWECLFLFLFVTAEQ